MNENMNNESKKDNVIMVLLIIIILLLVGVIVFMLIGGKGDNNKQNNQPTNNETINNNTNNNQNNNNTNNQQENIETEVAINDYKYLLERLEKTYGYFDINNYLNTNSFKDEIKINTAIAGLKTEKINFKSTDSCDVAEGYNIRSLYDDFKNGYDGYSATNVENEIKKIYGKNTTVVHKADGAIAYDKTVKAYLIIPSGLGNMPTTLQHINKITKDNNNIYIYTSVGLDDQINEEICYDVSGKNCAKKSSIDKKYFTSTKEGEEVIETLNVKQYMTDNKSKFEQYKYTFEKEDNNYIIKKLEKIN